MKPPPVLPTATSTPTRDPGPELQGGQPAQGTRDLQLRFRCTDVGVELGLTRAAFCQVSQCN